MLRALFLITFVFSGAALAAERQSLSDFIAERSTRSVEVLTQGKLEWVPGRIVRVGTDFVCIEFDPTPAVKQNVNCYPFSSVIRIFDREEKLLFTVSDR